MMFDIQCLGPEELSAPLRAGLANAVRAGLWTVAVAVILIIIIIRVHDAALTHHQSTSRVIDTCNTHYFQQGIHCRDILI